MTILTVRVDGYPYRIEFAGTIEVQRLESGNVAVRKVSDDATVTVALDQEEMERSRKFLADLHDRELSWDIYFNGISEKIQKTYGKLPGREAAKIQRREIERRIQSAWEDRP